MKKINKFVAAAILITTPLLFTGCASPSQPEIKDNSQDPYFAACASLHDFMSTYLSGDVDLNENIQKASLVAAEFRAVGDANSETFATVMDGFAASGGAYAQDTNGWGTLVDFCESRR